jgi:small subunit ribosomal protein S2
MSNKKEEKIEKEESVKEKKESKEDSEKKRTVKKSDVKPKKKTTKKTVKKPKKEEEEKGSEKEVKENPKENKIKKEDSEKKEELKKKLLEKVEGLKDKFESKDLKKEFSEKIGSDKTLVDAEDYLRYGCYLGTKVITPHLRQFVYKRRADGIAVIDVKLIDKRLRELCKKVSEYNIEDFIVVCKRDAGWNAVKMFCDITGVKCFTEKYPAGILTNTILKDFIDPKMVFICDPWVDKNALKDSKKMGKKILGLCDTNNYAQELDFFVPCNNKSNKSYGLIFYVLTREYLKAKGIEKQIPPIEEFVGKDV